MKVFAKALRFHMKRQHITGTKLEAKTGISRASISRWLNTQQAASIEAVGEIADALHVEPWQLLRDPEAAPSKAERALAFSIVRDEIDAIKIKPNKNS